MLSVQPAWCVKLPVQQQSVLLLAARGPDGVDKFHLTKEVVRAYRATVMVAAHSGRLLTPSDEGDTFMRLRSMMTDEQWYATCAVFFNYCDDLPHHYYMHLMHGAQIVGYKHPDIVLRSNWRFFYGACCRNLHVNEETEAQMDNRLNDGGRQW